MARRLGRVVVIAEVQGTPFLDRPLTIDAGERVWLRGRNGSGKTTLLRLLAGLPVHVEGRASIDGQGAVAAPRASWCPQDARDALVGLTVAGEARMRRCAPSDGLPPHDDVTTLSDGQVRRLALSLMAGRLWLLDEPTEGLDDAGIAWLRRRIQEADTVVFTDHTGRLADLATRTVSLGRDEAPHAFRLPTPDARPRMTAPPGRDADRGVAWPALALGTGVHVLHGPNGRGKTTWLERLASPDGCRIDGRRAVPGRDVRMLMAHGRDHLLGDRVAHDLARCDAAVRRALVPDRLLDRHPLTLSGGEAQRVALAKVLGVAAPVVLLDEPEAHLDDDGRLALETILARHTGVVLVASHDPAWPSTHGVEAP